MSKPIIEVHDLSKQYRLGVIGATTLRDSFDRFWQRLRNGRTGERVKGQPASSIEDRASSIEHPQSEGPFNRKSKIENGSPTPPSQDFIWAIKDVSFEVQQGEVPRNTECFTSSGRNGAGKSTLLKILSRITEPSCGFVSIRGRIASLLEVGTGFHPELTGRENIASSQQADFDAFCGEEDLNGAILGMMKAYIERKFKDPRGLHETVAFAEVERFIDTPVKRYSSGMYVRLAFAVAAHLEPGFCSWTRCCRWGMLRFRRSAWGRWGTWRKRDGRYCLQAIVWEQSPDYVEESACHTLEEGMINW